MFIKRIGKSLTSCSEGYYYKVVSTDKKTVSFLDNNGEIGTARRNSNKWDFSIKEDISVSSIGSKEPTTDKPISSKSTNVVCNTTSSSGSSNTSGSSDLTAGLIIGSLLL